MTLAPFVTLLAAAALAACGSSGTGSGTGGGTPGVPPISTHDPAPPSTDPPGTTRESPGVGGAGTGCAPCGLELSCVDPMGSQYQAVSVYLWPYEGVCVASGNPQPELSDTNPVLGCDGVLTELVGGRATGTWTRLSGGQTQFCVAYGLTGSGCLTCSPAARLDAGADVQIGGIAFPGGAG